jgi:hypothetical protein
MKTCGKALCLILLACVLAASCWGQVPPKTAVGNKPAATSSTASNVHTTDDPDVLRETQLGVTTSGYAGVVWWIPFAFWTYSAEKAGNPPEKTRENLKALKDYTVVGVFLAKVSALGAFDYVTPSELQKKIFIRDSDDQEYPALAELTGDAKNLADVVRPMLANAMGRAGENFAMLFFPARGKSGKMIADENARGQFSVVLKDALSEPETIFLWHLPLNSFSTPRYCPVGKERVHSDWDYCPWHGVKLENKP